MNKAEHEKLMLSINDSITVIKGNAQLALEVHRPKWVDRYYRKLTNLLTG